MAISDNTYDKLVDFRIGNIEDYSSMKDSNLIHEEDLYFIDNEIPLGDENTINMVNMYLGKNLVGDNYNSAYIEDLDREVTNKVGNIEAGTTLREILSDTRGSLSRLIDFILFG